MSLSDDVSLRSLSFCPDSIKAALSAMAREERKSQATSANCHVTVSQQLLLAPDTKCRCSIVAFVRS